MNVDVEGGERSSISIVSQCAFTGNSGLGPGGAIHLYQLTGHTSIKIQDSTFTDNRVSILVTIPICVIMIVEWYATCFVLFSVQHTFLMHELLS